ncbi:MAG: BlaI/MecI/CopY family transcriptional regulator [Candidatus Saccharimonadales bacterium]
MARPVSDLPTQREAQLLEALWNLGAATAEQVRAALPDEPHDSTVRTVLRVLESKGYVKHDVRGKTFVYRAAVPRTKAQCAAARSFVSRLFGGSAEDLVLRLLENEQLTPEGLERIRKSTLASRRPRRTPSPRKGGSP